MLAVMAAGGKAWRRPVTRFKRALEPSIHLARLTLRAFTDADEGRLFQSVRNSSAELMPFLPWCHPKYARKDAKTWIRFAQATWRDQTQFAFLIEASATGALIGGVGLDSPDANGDANLGYWIRTDCTGYGYATEAALGLAAEGLQRLELNRVLITLSVNNFASRQVAIKTGAQFLRKTTGGLTLHGVKHDALVFALTQPNIHLTV